MTDKIKWRITNSLPAEGQNFGVYNDVGDPTKAKLEILPAGQVNVGGPARFGGAQPEAKADDALTVNGKTRLHGATHVSGGAMTVDGDLTVAGKTTVTRLEGGNVEFRVDGLSLHQKQDMKGLVLGPRFPDWAKRWGNGMLHIGGPVAQLSFEYDGPEKGVDPDRRHFLVSQGGALIIGSDRKGESVKHNLLVNETLIEARTEFKTKAKLHAEGNLEVSGAATFKGSVKVENLSTGGYVFIKNENPNIRHADRFLQVEQNDNKVKCSPNTGDWEKWSFQISSSRSLKENIERLDHREAKAALMAMEPVKYDYIDAPAWRPNLGFIAEDMPDMLRSHDRKTISFFEAIPVMTRVIQEHERTIARLEARIDQLLARLETQAGAG